MYKPLYIPGTNKQNKTTCEQFAAHPSYTEANKLFADCTVLYSKATTIIVFWTEFLDLGYFR